MKFSDSNWVLLIILGGFSAFLTFFLTKFHIGIASKIGLLDRPNARSAHTNPTPRGGGIAFIIAFIMVSVVAFPFISQLEMAYYFSWLIPSLAIVIVGLVDDVRTVSAPVRLFVHFFAVGLSLLFWMLESFNYYTPMYFFVIFLFGCVWMVNLYNFMDGTDGIAATEAIFIFGAAALLTKVPELAVLCTLICFCVAGFLILNWPRASVFMGDSGSGFLGFLICAFFLEEFFRGHRINACIWILLTSTFWFDATMTLFRRVLRREKFSQAHSSHAYQRLHHKAGWSHRKVMLTYIALNFIVVGIALSIFYRLGPSIEALAISLLMVIFSLGICYWKVERIAPMNPKASS